MLELQRSSASVEKEKFDWTERKHAQLSRRHCDYLRVYKRSFMESLVVFDGSFEHYSCFLFYCPSPLSLASDVYTVSICKPKLYILSPLFSAYFFGIEKRSYFFWLPAAFCCNQGFVVKFFVLG